MCCGLLQRGNFGVPSFSVKLSIEAASQEESGMLPSASLAGAIAGILTVAAMAAHVLVDVAFRAFGG